MAVVPSEGVRERIAADLRHAILSGALGPGHKLPSERQLAARFGTGRTTVREAIGLLRDEGLVVPEHGRGVFVREMPRPRRAPPGPLRAALTVPHHPHVTQPGETGTAPGAAAGNGRKELPFTRERPGPPAGGIRVEVLDSGRGPAPDWVAERLGLRRGKGVLVCRHRHTADGRPVALVDVYAVITVAGDGNSGTCVHAAGAARGRGVRVCACLLAVGPGPEDVAARMPLPEEREALDMRRGVPLLEIVHVAGGAKGLTHRLLPADRHVLRYRSDHI